MPMLVENTGWSARQIRAAFWVGHVLGEEGEEAKTAHASWPHLPVAGSVDFADLRWAEQRLLEAGLVQRDGTSLRASPELQAASVAYDDDTTELLLALILECSAPLWLQTAAGDGTKIASELIPDEIGATLATVLPDAALREAFLLARARTVDARAREVLGAAGELAVVRACRAELNDLGAPELAAAVRRVSVVSDELGYDVTAPRLDHSTRRLEVKATRSSGIVDVFLTRNEVSIGLADPNWYLVVVRVGHDGHGAVAGHMRALKLKPVLPTDHDSRARWHAVRLRVQPDWLATGLPSA